MKNVMMRISMVLFTLLVPFAAFAQEAGAEAYKSLGLALGAGFAIGIGALGGAGGQGRAVVAALESIGRNPGSADKVFVPMIIGLALIESLVIYALLIAFMLLNKIA